MIIMAVQLQTLNEIDNLSIARAVMCDTTDLLKHYNQHEGDLTIISQNICSIYCNFDDFLITLSTLKFKTDIIILTECHLNTDKPIPKLENYRSYQTTNHLNKNDGVTVYIRQTLSCNVKEVIITEASCLEVDLVSSIILCIYRSPANKKAENFISSLGAHLETLEKRRNVVIAGDININLISKPTEQSNDILNRTTYLEILSSYGILPGHSLPTRKGSCLDHFMLKLNDKKETAFIAILHTTITDHATTLLVLAKAKQEHILSKIKTTVNLDNALKYFQGLNIKELLHCNDPNELIENLLNKITESILKNTKVSKIPKTKRVIKPWMTPGLLKCIQNRNNLQRQLRSDPDNEIKKITFKRYRNFCNNLLKKVKRKYEQQVLANSVNNNKLLWKNVKQITYTNKIKTLNEELTKIRPLPNDSTNFINEYFANIGKDLAEIILETTSQLDRNNYLKHIPDQCQSMALLDTDPEEINSVIMNLKSDSAPGWDNISTCYLKVIRHEIIPILTHFFNLCFRTGTFPAPLKKSIITPVYKGGDKNDVNNYRPISVLSVFSKIFEKLLNTRLIKYLSTFNILSSNQYGFRKGISTEDAVVSLTSHISEQLDKGNKCLSIFIDLKKAFDTVSVPILLRKLEKIGVRGTTLSIFQNYLSNRKQMVKLNQHTSNLTDVHYGVPQGSVLGPTLFLVYINDLCTMDLPNAKIFTYADDTAIVFNGPTWKTANANAENGMVLVAKWLKNNLLTLNTSKTNYICFSIKNNTQPELNFNLKIHECNRLVNHFCTCPSINRVNQTKYLGIMIDHKLSWYPQIELISSRIRKLIWLFKSLRYVVPPHSRNRNLLNELYIALVQSIISYCIPVWGGAYKTRFIEVERAQRALIKVMYFKSRRFPTNLLYEISNLLSVRKLYIIHTVTKIHKTITYDPSTENRRRKNVVIKVPTTKTVFAKLQYGALSARLYNAVNKKIQIYNKSYQECKHTLTNWIKTVNYEETELILKHRNSY